MSAYSVIKKLGEGGMGVVYLANQTSLDRKVALKLLNESSKANPQYFGRFLREVQASTRVSHENIIKIIDYGEIEGQPFYAMEYLAAPTLEERYKNDGVLPIPLAVKVCEQLLSALSCMHRAGLVHRDLKPSNVMIDESGHATLMDFGLVKDLERTQFTAQGKIVGTPGYLSPESILGKPVDGRADLFSLGILMWEVLCGERPFGGDSLQALLIGIVKGAHVPIPKRRADCPPWLSGFIDRLLTKEPDGRFPSAAAALKGLALAQGKPVREDADDSVDRIVDYSGELEMEAAVPQGSIEGGLKALGALPEEPKPEPSPALVTTAPMARRTRATRPIPRVTRTTQISTPGRTAPSLALAAGAGALAAVLLVGAWVALAPKSRPSPAESPSPSPVVSASPSAQAVAALQLNSAREAGRELATALDRLRPRDMIRQMHDDLMRVDKKVRTWYDQPPVPVLQVRARWADKLALISADLKLQAALSAFNWKKQEYYTSDEVAPGERLALYLKLHDFQDLVNWCRRCAVPLTAEPSQGFYERYGQLANTALPGTPAVLIAFTLGEHSKPVDMRKLATPPGDLAIPVREGERFFMLGDSRQEDVVGALEDISKTRLKYEHKEPLPLPPLSDVADLELTGWVSDLADNNRFVIAAAQDREPFRDVAVIRGKFGGLKVFSHTLERGMFTGSRLRLALRFEVTRNMMAWSEYANFPRLGIRYRRKR